MLGNPHLATNPPAPKVPERGSFGVKRMIESTISWYSFSCEGKNIINRISVTYLLVSNSYLQFHVLFIHRSYQCFKIVYITCIINFDINHIN